ncbi:MAG: zinc metallopeptidase [Clostridia bacterium]|nr:zinc metallopeptidase [Clostridia bacterium]MBO7320208.1 zinc metallopeptidase [Clostridia bacterium]
MFWYDYYYLILVVPALIISLIAQINVKKTYAAMAKIPNNKRLTGAQAAARVLEYYGIRDVRIEPVGGKLSDHYDPRANVIRLSQEVFSGTSIASIGIACHEAGHAAQHAQNYVPIKVRNFILPVANIGSTVGFYLAIFGYFLGYGILVDIGIILFASVTVFQLVTLPIEFNASRRAISVIEETEMLFTDEVPKAKKVLFAAAMTYVAALLVSIMSLLRLILRTRNRRN